jgi:amino acid transporter/nucleotide-binding universal stress UspA family protein
MTSSGEAANSDGSRGRRILRAAQVIVVSSVMFTFISYWRTAAVVLCDLASTAYYIGAIVEQAIGPAAPWFILVVMCFSYAVRWVYIESCTLFVRGGVYRVVREALGRFLAKIAVSALMFDYVLTGPISGVTAGQYLIGLGLEVLAYATGNQLDKTTQKTIIQWGSVVFACAITVYFFRKNIIGIHESSEKALKIMIITTIMAVVMFAWCGITLWVQGPKSSVFRDVNLGPKIDYSAEDPATAPKVDPTGFLSETALAEKLRNLHGKDWLSLIGLMGLFIAFGHSILAMSGEETLAQVYREVESPKLPNFKKAAFIVFIYSLILTGGISFLAVMLIPDGVRMEKYSSNLIGGLAMNMYGPEGARLLLNAFVCVVGFMILAGAVNTAIIGSNGVLNRVAEDGVMPDWFLKPHPRYGTSYRVLYLIVGMQLATILISRGKVIWLGEAYAFGVIWSFVFQALSMVVLRFKDPRPREFKVPLNIRVGRIEVPVGLLLILLILLISAVMNLLTKESATIGGGIFTAVFFTIFYASERYHERRRRGMRHEHLEQFNQRATEEVSVASLGLTKPYRKLVSIRSPQNLFMLEKTLAETDPDTTDVIIMTAKVTPPGETPSDGLNLDPYDQELMTAVVQRAEKAGKQVKPLILPTNNALYAIIRTAKDLQVQELVVGASNKYTADEQLDQIAFYWMNLHEGQSVPLTVRILGRDRDVLLDLGGGNRIPKISERQARSVAELRAAGVGVDRVLLAHYGDPESGDLFDAVLTMLDPQVALTLVFVEAEPAIPTNGNNILQRNLQRAQQLGRAVQLHALRDSDAGSEIVRLAREDKYDLLIVGLHPTTAEHQKPALDVQQILRNAPCQVFLASPPAIPLEPEE